MNLYTALLMIVQTVGTNGIQHIHGFQNQWVNTAATAVASIATTQLTSFQINNSTLAPSHM